MYFYKSGVKHYNFPEGQGKARETANRGSAERHAGNDTMDQGIRAVWYDLEDAKRADYLTWLHDAYLPEVMARPGILWAAHYEITGGGAAMDQIGGVLARMDAGTNADIGTGTLFLYAKTKEDLTRSVLTQIIVEEEGKGQSLLSENFLRQIITC